MGEKERGKSRRRKTTTTAWGDNIKIDLSEIGGKLWTALI
jgi:hypothetical protein